jgi:hypothetical protein
MPDQAVDAVIRRGTSKTVPRNLSFSGDFSATPTPSCLSRFVPPGRNRTRGTKAAQYVCAGGSDVPPPSMRRSSSQWQRRRTIGRSPAGRVRAPTAQGHDHVPIHALRRRPSVERCSGASEERSQRTRAGTASGSTRAPGSQRRVVAERDVGDEHQHVGRSRGRTDESMASTASFIQGTASGRETGTRKEASG